MLQWRRSTKIKKGVTQTVVVYYIGILKFGSIIDMYNISNSMSINIEMRTL